MKDAHAVSTKENRLSVSPPCVLCLSICLLKLAQVEQKLLYHCLPELESSQSWNGIDTLDQNSANLVGLLVDYLRETYAETTQNLKSHLKKGEITYDLL